MVNFIVMDQSYSESDLSMSPSQILERLQVLRQLQLLQRGKLQKQRLEYHETTETSSNITEIVSHFSNTTSYNTFRSLLQSSCDASNEASPRVNASKNSKKVNEQDLIDGVSTLNLSQESEFIVNSPLSAKSKSSSDPYHHIQLSAPSRDENLNSSENYIEKTPTKKAIALDEMPILTPKQDFEALILEKLKTEKAQDRIVKPYEPRTSHEIAGQNKRPFLRKGEGMARFGVKKTDLKIQPVRALPWRRKSLEKRVIHTPKKLKPYNKVDVQIMSHEPLQEHKSQSPNKPEIDIKPNEIKPPSKSLERKEKSKQSIRNNNSNTESSKNSTNGTTQESIFKPVPKIQLPKVKHPLQLNKGKTWAAVLTKEQDDFLRQLKQSDYYKNFNSPAKSMISDTSCDEHFHNIRQQREKAEQNMFELVENKVTNESFSMESSFFNRFLKQNMEFSGDSTPLIMQKCLANNPKLFHIFPEMKLKCNNQTLNEECSCDYTDCSDTCSVSSCSTCKTVEDNQPETRQEFHKDPKKKDPSNKPKIKEVDNQKKESHDDTVTETSEMKANIMAEMNAKLAATSELLKERLQELEDEIETFKKENNNLAKMREEIDLERQKFYEEKSAFEQKFNEEKILSEYYLAEEKEKLSKQKQTYERYVREMRGRLNKKEKDEVTNLKKEISDLREEIRNKDAKSTSTIARLRNQLKVMEKEKATLQDEVEKLKKENRRIQHSNDITRRLTNVKYLEEINKKLSNITKNTQSEVEVDNDVKYKAYEIERQSRSRKVQPITKGTERRRAKSVPNLKVTSRYAKYFSQRDALSHFEGQESTKQYLTNRYASDDENENNKLNLESDPESCDENNEPVEEENHLEKIYMERFQNASPVSNRSSLSNSEKLPYAQNPDPFFIRKTNMNCSKSPNEISSIQSNSIRSKSPVSILSNRSGRKSPTIDQLRINNSAESNNSAKSVDSNLSNHFLSQRNNTVINQEGYRDKLMNVSPEPTTSKTSVAKTNLNPIEIKKSDGSKELRYPNGNVKYISADGKYSKFLYYNGDIKENFYSEGRIKYYYAEAKTYHTTHADGLEVLEFPDGQVEKRYKDGSSEIRLPNGSVRYQDPKSEHVREEWRFPDGTQVTVSANGDKRIVFSNGQVEVHAKDHKRREFPDGTVKLVYTDGTSETRYASGRVRIKDKHGNLIMDSAPG